jgi:hypothetical protein
MNPQPQTGRKSSAQANMMARWLACSKKRDDTNMPPIQLLSVILVVVVVARNRNRKMPCAAYAF